MIHVLATIELVDGRRDDFVAEFKQLVPLVHAEKGCEYYAPVVDTETDIEAQAELRANSLTVIERWESLESLKDHLVAPHMADYREKVKDMVVGMQLRILTDA